ncbi:MAG: conjugal transfer protein TraF [bacterium]
MKKVCILLILVLVPAFSVATAHAFPFPYTDVRGQAMGGAYVAAAKGVGSVNYNPAGLARGRMFEFVAPFTVRFDDHIDIDDKLTQIENITGGQSFAIWASNATISDLDQIVSLIGQLNVPGENSIDLRMYTSGGVSLNAFGLAGAVSYNYEVIASMITSMDTTNISTTPGPSFIGTNNSELLFRGIEDRQVVLTGAKEFGTYALGANLRQIQAKTYATSLALFNNTNPDIKDELTKNGKSESATAIDVGLQFELLPTLRGGIVGKNINSPEFTLPGTGGVLELESRYRAGIAWDLPMVMVVADLDLTTTSSLSGAEFREMAVGAEINLIGIQLRAGLSQNLALDGANALIHAGFGLGGFLDVAASTDADGKSISGGAAISLKF